MGLPNHANVTLDQISALASQHHLPQTITRLPDIGIFNAVYQIGESHILRIPRQHPAHFRALVKESIAVPLARGAGIRTPELSVYDDSRSLLPVPYTIYRRVPGVTLADLDLEPEVAFGIWRELGRDLAHLHGGIDRVGAADTLENLEPLPDPRDLAEMLATGGWITGREARWLTAWLVRLAPDAAEPVECRLLHGDTQDTNVMVDPQTREYVAVLDWGAAGWGDPAWDFAGIPIRAVPYMLQGYQAVAPAASMEGMERRILWRHLQLALFTARRGPRPGESWAERPLTMLLEIARFFMGDLSPEWSELRPR